MTAVAEWNSGAFDVAHLLVLDAKGYDTLSTEEAHEGHALPRGRYRRMLRGLYRK